MDRSEIIGYLSPVVHARVAGHSQVMRRCIQNPLPNKSLEIPREIIDQIIRPHNSLIATKNVI